jgi:hypothetical protein
MSIGESPMLLSLCEPKNLTEGRYFPARGAEDQGSRWPEILHMPTRFWFIHISSLNPVYCSSVFQVHTVQILPCLFLYLIQYQ